MTSASARSSIALRAACSRAGRRAERRAISLSIQSSSADGRSTLLRLGWFSVTLMVGLERADVRLRRPQMRTVTELAPASSGGSPGGRDWGDLIFGRTLPALFFGLFIVYQLLVTSLAATRLAEPAASLDDYLSFA